MKETSKLFLAFAAGIAAGAAIAELIRTQKGQQVVDEVENLTNKVKKSMGDLQDLASSIRGKTSSGGAGTSTAGSTGTPGAGSTGGSAGQ